VRRGARRLPIPSHLDASMTFEDMSRAVTLARI
jgi:hypothetical protein